MTKYETAMKLLSERVGNADKDNLISLGTISLSPSATGTPRPAVRMVNAYYENGAFYISSDARKNKTLEIQQNSEVAIGGLDWFMAHGTAENLGWVKDEKNADIRAKMKKNFSWFDDHGGEDDPNSIVLKVTIYAGTIIDNEQKYGQWKFEVDFVNKTAE